MKVFLTAAITRIASTSSVRATPTPGAPGNTTFSFRSTNLTCASSRAMKWSVAAERAINISFLAHPIRTTVDMEIPQGCHAREAEIAVSSGCVGEL